MRFALLVAILILVTHVSPSQQLFKPIPDDDVTRYRLDFEKLFFRSPIAERESYAELQGMLSRFKAFEGHCTRSGDTLFTVLALYDSILVRQALHDAYLYMRNAVNTDDIESAHRETALLAEVAEHTQFLQHELMQVSSDELSRFLRENPGLLPYKYEIACAGRDRSYTLPKEEEERLHRLSPVITGWQNEWYQQLLGRIPFSTIATPDGRSLNVWTDRGTIANHPDRKIREDGFRSRYRDLSKDRDLFALLLKDQVLARNAYAQAHHYADFPDESYHARYLRVAEVKQLIQQVESHAHIYKQFETIRREHVQRTSRIADVQYWDITSGGGGSNMPRFDIHQATDIILQTIRPFGSDYRSEMADLLHPESGRLDIVPGGHRLSGGGGVGFPGIPNVFYSHGFEGYYKDVSVLIHEAGHVVHFQLMGKNHVKAVYGNGPQYLSESFSIFNELLLADRLYHAETDPAKKAFYLEQFLDVKGLEVFKAARDAHLEQAIYDAVEGGTMHTAEDLDSLTLGILSTYSIWPSLYPDEMKNTWITLRLVYEDPFYLVNYLYGGLLSLKYYEMYVNHPKTFLQGYLSLMRNGYTDEPAVLLKRFLHIDMNDPHLLKDAMALLEARSGELRSLYATLGSR